MIELYYKDEYFNWDCLGVYEDKLVVFFFFCYKMFFF